jgi:ABC-type branched-subunit amino acid transport system ATPase component
MAILDITDLHAGYGKFLVLTGVDITVEEGEIVCLIGPNGAGKSTVFNAVFNFIDPSTGTIRFKGESTLGRSQSELLGDGMSYVLQRNAAFPDMSVRENLELGAYVEGRDFDVDGKIEEMYGMFPALEKYDSTKAKALSGGQQKMLELARGMMLDPDLLLLDEPTAGLAPKIIDDVFAKVAEINAKGVTVFMIEQNIKTGIKYSDYAYVMEDGETRFDGAADTILDRPEIREAYLSEHADD